MVIYTRLYGNLDELSKNLKDKNIYRVKISNREYHIRNERENADRVDVHTLYYYVVFGFVS